MRSDRDLFLAIVSSRIEQEREDANRNICERAFAGATPQQLAHALRQADTRQRRAVFESRGLPKKPPNEQTAKELLDQVRSGDIELQIDLSLLVRSTYDRLLQRVSHGPPLEEMHSSAQDLVAWAGDQAKGIPVGIAKIAMATDLLLRPQREATVFSLALAAHLTAEDETDPADDPLSALLGLRFAASRDDGGLTLAHRLAEHLRHHVGEVSELLAEVEEASATFSSTEHLAEIATQLKHLGSLAQMAEQLVDITNGLLSQRGADELNPTACTLAEIERALGTITHVKDDDTNAQVRRLTGPDSVADQIASLQALSTERASNGEPTSPAIAALISVVDGSTTDMYADLDTFVAEHPQWRALTYAAASGDLTVGDEVTKSDDGQDRRQNLADDAEVRSPNLGGLSEPAPNGDSIESSAAKPSPRKPADNDQIQANELSEEDGAIEIDGEPLVADLEEPPATSPRSAEVHSTNGEPTINDDESDSPASNEENQLLVAAESEHESEPDENREAEVLTIAQAKALKARRLGLAAQIAGVTGRADRKLAWELAALAVAAQAASGPCANRFVLRTNAHLSELTSLDDKAARLVLLIASLRLSLVAPHSGASGVASDLSNTLPEIEPFLDTALAAAQRGVAMIGDVLDTAWSIEEAETLVDRAAADAAEFLATAGNRRIKFHRATEVWKTLIGPGGVLRQLLDPVTARYASIEERLDVAERLRVEAVDLLAEKVRDAAMTSADRTRSRGEIEFGAAERLNNMWEEVVQLALGWADAVQVANRARQSGGPVWQQEILDQLQRAEETCREPVTAALQRMSKGDPLIEGAASFAASVLQDIGDLLAGKRSVRTEADPSRLMTADLLIVPGTRFSNDHELLSTDQATNADWLQAASSEDFEGSLRLACETRIDALDFVGAQLILETLQSPDSELEQRRAEALSLSRLTLGELWSATNDRVADDRRLGFLDETLWRRWSSALNELDPGQRDDHDVLAGGIADIRTRSTENRDRAIREFRVDLETLVSENAQIAAVLGSIEERLADGDLTTAWEYVSLARDGHEIPSRTDDQRPQGTLSAEDDEALEGVDITGSAVRQSILSGSRVGPLDFADLTDQDREVADEALRSWRAIHREFEKRTIAWEDALSPILRLLGITFQSIRIAPEDNPRAKDHHWLDLVGFDAEGDALVPAFASEPRRIRVQKLLVASGGAGRLDAMLGRSRVTDPIMVFHLGCLGPRGRRDAAEASRKAGREVAVMDDNMLAWIASTGSRRYDHTMRALLPFVSTNPYLPDAYGLVPETMFYGRSDEIDRILRMRGTSYLYGGRQLGKSALLRYAKRRFEVDADHLALYVDLKAKQVGRPRPAEAIWEEIWALLADRGVVSGEMPKAVAKSVEGAITDWLDASPGRTMLILLDECDQFIEADQTGHLAVAARLKGFMEETDRRCKFVFAGLHTVQRFASVATGSANTPLAHLGEPLAIGPLAAHDAVSLVTEPLEALGYEFESFDLVNRILAHTNRQPALLVIFMHHLVQRLSSRARWRSPVPTIITAEHINRTWADPVVAMAIRERISLTLRLDPAYHVIAHVVALNHHVYGDTYRTTVASLKEDCCYYWPAGFGGMQMADFTLIADEMVGLGVLAREGGGYMLRSPNVSRLLGSREDIEGALVEASTLEPISAFEPTLWRRDMNPSHTTGSAPTRSPVTDAQLASLLRHETGVSLVVGTRASGIERVEEALESAASRTTTFTKRSLSDGNVDRLFQTLGDGRHRIVVVLFNGANTDMAIASLNQAISATSPDRRRSAQAGTVSIIFVADAFRDGGLVRHALGTGVVEELDIVQLRLWSEGALVAFGRDAGLPFDTERQAKVLRAATGGWDTLVARAAHRCAGGSSLESAIEDLDGQMVVSECGLAEDALAFQGCRQLVSLLSTDGDTVNDACELLTLASDGPRIESVEQAGAVVSQLILANLLVEGDGRIAVEPLAARAFGEKQ